mmetsp:Transcript_14960/g.52507  ORF Transcript_14960/g.52507 Transcript_14960/m.52507 type:complete len:233 (-) Transcript_14960:741-1439(-)
MGAHNHARRRWLVLQLGSRQAVATKKIAHLLLHHRRGQSEDALRRTERWLQRKNAIWKHILLAHRARTPVNAALVELAYDPMLGQINIPSVAMHWVRKGNPRPCVRLSATPRHRIQQHRRIPRVPRNLRRAVCVPEILEVVRGEGQGVRHLVDGSGYLPVRVGRGHRNLRSAEIDEAEDRAIALVLDASCCMCLHIALAIVVLDRYEKEEVDALGAGALGQGRAIVAGLAGV